MIRKYKIIVVDDEDEIRNRIISKIPQDMGFQVVGQAANGFDALEVIEREKPDVVLTDIKMPFIDGIELSKIIRKDYPKTKIAFISGYDEFAYAKEAIALDVISYLSKPITEIEIIECLKKIKTRLDDEYQILFNQERLDLIYETNLPALIENQFNSISHLASITDQDLEKFKVFNIDLSKGEFMVGIIEIDNIAEFIKIEQLRIFLINLLKKEFNNYCELFYFNTGSGLVFILNHEKLNNKEIETQLYRIVLTKDEFSNIKIKIGISEVFSDFKQISKYILQSKKALSYGSYLNIGDVIYYKDITTRKKIELKLTKDEIYEISYTLKFKTEADIHGLFDRMIKNNELNQEYLLNKQYYIINLANIFVEFSQSLHVELHDIIDSEIIETLSRYEDLSSMFEFLKKLTFDIRSLNVEKSKNRASIILEEAISYINAHYMDSNLNMDVLTDVLDVSASYLSALFKRERDTTFNQYLIKIRMDHARELLKYTNIKIYEIATSVGYNDVYYFSYSFKKYMKSSPREYRNDQKI
ncbi:MAG: response regulator [Firmicutes bacterium]|nr:response regulator [Bacillota bacterium]